MGEGADEWTQAKTLIKPADQLELTDAVSKLGLQSYWGQVPTEAMTPQETRRVQVSCWCGPESPEFQSSVDSKLC